MNTDYAIVLIGSGGHARVCADVIASLGVFQVAGCVSNETGWKNGPAILGNDSVLPDLRAAGYRNAFVAIGDNRIRERIATHLAADGWAIPAIVHRNAILGSDVTIGSGSVLMPGSIVNACSHIGRYSIVNTGASADHDCVIGNCAHLAPGSSLCGGVRVGDRALVGVGANIVPNITIGIDAVVAAGATVTRDVKPGTTVYGTPAKEKR